MTHVLVKAEKNTRSAAAHNETNFGELMERHIVEILVILLRQYPEGGINSDEFEPLTDDLIGLGYTKQEIESALFWFYNRLEVRKTISFIKEIETKSFRVLHDVERSILTSEAYGYLIELRQLGILSLVEMDRIIEKAVLLGGHKVTVEEIKTFVAISIIDQETFFPIPGHTFYLKTPTDNIQ